MRWSGSMTDDPVSRGDVREEAEGRKKTPSRDQAEYIRDAVCKTAYPTDLSAPRKLIMQSRSCDPDGIPRLKERVYRRCRQQGKSRTTVC